MSLSLHELLITGNGSINTIVGPMFSGKTTELISRLRKGLVAEIPCCLIRAGIDTRWPDEGPDVIVRTHSGIRLLTEEGIPMIRATTIEEAIPHIPAGCKIVAVDEGQFFLDLARGCCELATSGYLVHVAALNGAHDQKPWPCVSDLLAVSEEIMKLDAWCMECKIRPAHFTRRKRMEMSSAGVVARDDPGGKEKYLAVCRVCLNL